jgi:hypothetical protein
MRMRDHVTCAVCGARGKGLGSHVRVHGLTTSQYREKFPDTPIDSLATRQKRRAARPNMELARTHRGEKPTRYWDVAKLLVGGKSAAEIGTSIGRGPVRVKTIARKLGLSCRPSRYDLGVRLTRAQLANLQQATGLDGPSFEIRFGVPSWLIHGKSARAKQILSPRHAEAIIAARDKIISDVYRLAQNKGRGRYTGSSPKVLNSLVPHFPQAIATLRGLLADRKERSREEWQDYICEQARTRAGSASVLALAVELSPWIEERLNELQKRQDLWRLAVEILASRFGVSSSVASEKNVRVRPREMERLILRLDPDRRTAQRGTPSAPDGLAIPSVKLPRGRRRKNPMVDYGKAATLRADGLSWRQIAMKLDHENWAKGGNSRKAAADRIRVGVAQLGRGSSSAAPSFLGGEK